MKLSDQQFIFTKNVMKLFEYLDSLIDTNNIDKFVIGEVWRRNDIMDCPKCDHNFTFQDWLIFKGWSRTKKSYHHQKLAIDIYFWKNGKFVQNKSENKRLIDPIGVYWEGLDNLNRWGGHYIGFVDIPHFEMRRIVKHPLNGADP